MYIDFPFHFDARGRTADTTFPDHVRDMIEELLFTHPGERVNRPEFGAGLLQLLFAPNRPELSAALQFTVQAGLDRWLGDLVEVRKLEVDVRDAEIHIDIAYALRSTGEQREDSFVRSAP